MKTLLAVCVAVCVGAVYSQIGPLDPGDRFVRPPDLQVVQACVLQIGPWGFGDPFHLGWHNGKFYFNCRAWQPTWSECKGNCGDSWTRQTKLAYTQHCECCRAHVRNVHTPRWVWCQTLHFQNGCVWVWGSGWAFGHPNLAQHPYYTLADCRCAPCNPWTRGRKRRDVDSIDGLRRVEVAEPRDIPTAPTLSVREPTEDEAREVAKEAGVEYLQCELVTRPL